MRNTVEKISSIPYWYGTAITTGFACGVVTPAALVCYGGAAMVGL